MRKLLLPWIMAVVVLLSAPLVEAQQVDSSISSDTADNATDATTDQTAAESDNGNQRQPIPDDAELGLVRRSIVIVDDAQATASERFGAFMEGVDGFFSRGDADDDAVSNGSWARIRLDGVRANAEGFKLEPKVKVRAVLPQTERKLKLLISTEDDENTETSDVQQSPEGSDQSASLALRFVRTAKEKGDVNLDIGVRQRDGSVQYFGRLNTHLTLDLEHDWSGKVGNSYYHYSKSGFENRLSLNVWRRFFNAEHTFFSTYTDAFWEKGLKGALFGHTSGLYWQFGDTRSLALEVLASYNTALNEGASDRFNGHEYRIRWRHNVWRPWFFYEVWPSVSWPSSRQYRKTEGILIRAEVLIGQQK